MTVLELITMFIFEDEQYFELWDNATEQTVFRGYLTDLTEELEEAKVTSIDNISKDTDFNGITLNIDIY